MGRLIIFCVSIAVMLTEANSFDFDNFEETKTSNTNDRAVQLKGDIADSKFPEFLREKKLGTYSTTTITAVSLTTSTIYSSCLKGVNDAACGKRRLKKINKRQLKHLNLLKELVFYILFYVMVKFLNS